MIAKLKSLFQHQGFKKYFVNTSWLFAEKILRMVVGLFVEIWVARYLGPDRFGLLSYAGSFVGLFSAIATLGLNGIVVRELVKYPEKENEIIGTAFILKLFGAFLTLIILYIAIHFTSNDAYTNILIFIIASATVFQAFNVIDMYFQAKVMSKYVVFANTFSLFISSIFKIILILNEAPLIAFAGMVVFDSLVMALGYVYWYCKVKKEFFLKKIIFKFEVAKQLLKDSWPLILSGIAIGINTKIDQVMIKIFLNNYYVGIYSVGIKLAITLSILPHMISSSIFPSFVNAYKKGESFFYKRIGLAYMYMFYIMLFLLLPFLFFGKEIILFLFGNKYKESGDILILFSLVILFSSIGAINSIYLRVTNKQKKIMNRQWINVILNIILNYYLIPLYGVRGAAVATMVSIMFSTIIYDLFDKDLKMMNLAKLYILGIRGV